MKGGEKLTEFETVYTDFSDFIYKYLLKLSQSPCVAEELTQETFFRAYINFSSLKDKERVSSWLCSIARNAFFAYLKEQKRYDGFAEEAAAAGDETPEEILIRKELSSRAEECLLRLEEPYREVFMLSVFGEMSLKEISEIYGKSESWARVTFYRAKQKLKERMNQKYGL